MATSHLYCTACGTANEQYDAYCSACGRPLRTTTSSMQYPTVGSANSTQTGLLAPNHLLKQQYRILAQLGQGGFGAVYKAEDTQFHNRLVAIKEMSQSGLQPDAVKEAAERFEQEAVMLANLRHPNLSRIYDHFSDGGRWYLVMDFIEGETLEEHLNKTSNGHLPIEEALQIGIQLCTVLNYLHTRKPPIIFRDLKPSNIMLTPDGHVYLIDFGIARLFKPGQAKDTIAFGSLGYAAPEQYGKSQTTAQSDIYSLGGILHQALTGNDPATNRPTPFDFPVLRLSGQPTPTRLETLIMQMVEKVVGKRPHSVSEIKKELQEILAEQSIRQISPLQSAAKRTLPPTLPVEGVLPSPPSFRGSKRIFSITAGVVILVVIIAILIPSLLNNHLQPSQSTSSSISTTPVQAPTLVPTSAPIPTATPIPPTPTPTPKVYHFTVNGTQDLPGLDTGIDVTIGDHLQTAAQGLITFGTNGIPYTNPDGQCQESVSGQCSQGSSKMDSSAVLSSAPIGELVAGITPPGSTSTMWFAVGSAYSNSIQLSGRLFLIYNDDPGYFGDNSGIYQVTITIAKG